MSEGKITYYEGPRILLSINGARHLLVGYWPGLGIIHVDGNGKRLGHGDPVTVTGHPEVTKRNGFNSVSWQSVNDAVAKLSKKALKGVK